MHLQKWLKKTLDDVQFYIEEQTGITKLSEICLKDSKELSCVDQDAVEIVVQVENSLTDDWFLLCASRFVTS